VVTGDLGQSGRAVRSVDRSQLRRSTYLTVPVLVALGYAVLGLLALEFGQTTGLASPIWPAAGLAFAAVAVWRWRAWPGVALGSFMVNSLWLWQAGETGAALWLTATGIAIGAMLQAGLGAGLVHFFVGRKLALDMPRSILLTLLLAGPVACLVGPTIGVASQLSAGILSPGTATLGWLTWWVGDAIGVIVFAPLVLMAIPSQREYWQGRRWLIALPSLLIVGALVTVILQNAAFERERIATAVQQLGDEAAADLVSNLARHQETLEGLRGLIDASDEVTASEFSIYTDDVLLRSPNLQALSWNPRVPRDELDVFIASQRDQPGLEDFTVTERDADGNLVPVGVRPEYVVVAYIEPLQDNRSALGYDIYSNPARAVAIETARDTGLPIGTAPIDLVQESGTQKGMLALLPVYEGGTDPGTEAARRAALRGFTVGVYRLGDLLTETYAESTWDDVEITLVDVTDRANPVVIADLQPRNAPDVDVITGAPTATTLPIDVYGRMWELTVHPTPNAFDNSSKALTITLLLASLAVAFLLEALLLLLSGLEARARREAEITSYEASHDHLTGLSNRRAFVRDFERLLEERGHATDILLFCDLDGFKEINDTGGHSAGDELLAAVAVELRGRVRHDDLVARMGGDEFAVLLRDCSLIDGLPIAEEIVRAIQGIRIESLAGPIGLGVSIGLAMVDPASGTSLDEHLRRADAASYKAKNSGGSRVVVFEDLPTAR
jgi:diguanylate cyclase (GGDEF)-like protein